MADRNARGPLDGVKVLDLTEHMAGPYCTMILADMGADVIKLERPGAGDSSRAMGDGSERNPYFRYINRNKKSLTLDYKARARPRDLPQAGRRAWTCSWRTTARPSWTAPGSAGRRSSR